MLTNPAQSGLFGQRLFQHWSAVREHPVTERTDSGGDVFGQPLQATP